MTALVPVEQAAVKAVARLLATALPDVVVGEDWPDPSKQLFNAASKHGAVTVLRVGERQDELIDPRVTDEKIIHAGISPRVDLDDATDLPSAEAVLEACVDSYEEHRLSTAAHASADTVDAVTAPPSTDLPSACLLANDLRTQYEAHRVAAAHTTPDPKSSLAAVPPATDLQTLLALVNAEKQVLAKHYVARVYVWLVAACRQPVQLDVWAAYPVWRDDIQARLEPLLNQDTVSVRPDPVRNGLLIALGDGWAGTADFQFSKPTDPRTPEAAQRSEYRLTYRGTAEFNLTIAAQSSRLAVVGLMARLARTLPAPLSTSQSLGTAAAATTAADATSTVRP